MDSKNISGGEISGLEQVPAVWTIKLVYPYHFILMCLYQAEKVNGHVYMCVRGINFDS